MKIVLGFLFVFVGFGITLKGQDKPSSVDPIHLDHNVISGLKLKPIPQKEEGKEFFQKRLFRGKEISVYVVSSSTWTSKFTDFWFDEFLYILNGQARIHPEFGEERVFNSGDYFFAPKGLKGEWEVKADQYYYELSVITNQRADSTKLSSSVFPILLNKNLLSGIGLTLVDSANLRYSDVLAKGIELEITLNAEKPQRYPVNNDKEKMIHVLAGLVEITNINGQHFKYKKGDFFILPEGFKGEWNSKGHHLFKAIHVFKVNEIQ